MNLTGVIIDGGYTTGLDFVPGLLKIGEETVIERQVREMKKVCQEIILVTNQPHSYLPILGGSIRMITDYYKGSGTLSGMYAALSLAKNDTLWVVTPDMPFISMDAMTQMLAEKDQSDVQLVVPEWEGNLQLYHAIYDRSCLEATQKLVEQDQLGIMNLLEHISFKVIRCMDNTSFTLRIKNVEDYQRVLDHDQHFKVTP
ncbi:molybdenum cofactor guanylyltransferase [Halalkalibacter alkalisediminis]|uniref:Molybdenum cofactor guanylyltransferase n=1 Tax=Halalkalibacter alkalisediminis TaxID=935616 RepID=A0ABV6NHG9_9BACI|nr:molybdenum cofactor guanylyltransferase [Halalkalibacter alkalisediminis]